MFHLKLYISSQIVAVEIKIYKIIKMLKYCLFYNKVEQCLFGVMLSRVISMCL